MGFCQVFDKSIILENIIHIPFIGFVGDGLAGELLERGDRIIGTDTLSIGFSLLLGYLFILSCVQYLNNKKNIWHPIFMTFLFFLILETQTRSAIYGILPSIFLSYAIIAKINIKNILIYGTIILCVIFSFQAIQNMIVKHSDRSKVEMDVNTYAKITANIYGVYGALSRNPIIGVSKSEQAKVIIEGKKELGTVIKKEGKEDAYITHHNLFGRYLRYYGLIGFSIFFVLVIKIFRKALNKDDLQDKLKLTAIFIYFFQFAQLHNNELLLSPIVWILLAIGEEKHDS